MSAVVPPAAPPPPPSGGGGAVVALQLLSEAATVEALPSRTLLEAVAQARAAKGIIEAMTPDGPVRLKALPGQVLPAIPEGAKLLFQVVNLGGEPQLRLLAVNGRPLLGAALPGMALPGMALPASLLAGGASGALPPQAGAVLSAMPSPGQAAPAGLTATLIRPAGMMGQAVAGLPSDLPAGTQLTVRIAGVTPPGASPPMTPPPGFPASPATPTAGPPTGPQPATPIPGTPLPGTPAAVATGAPAVPPIPATPATLPSAAPAAASVPPPAATPGTPVLHGTVSAQPPGGQALVQTPIGTLALATQTDLPVGTGLRLDVVGPPQPPAAAAAAATRPDGLTSAGWPALTEAAATLGADRQALDGLMRAIPQAGPRLAASLSVFAAAQRSGDVRAVLGDGTTKALDKAGRKDLADRLKNDLDSLSADSARPLGNGEWRGYTLPFVHGGVVDPIRLYVRGGGEGDARRQGGGTGNEQRFVLDFALSNLGRLQLDGLVRREEKLFDLIVRTTEPLAEPVRRDIMMIFADASELGGTKGGVSFHTDGRWVEPPPDAGPTRIEA